MTSIIFSIVRHLLTGFAGSLLYIGVSESDAHTFLQSATPVISGVVLYGASQAWSIVDKKLK